MNIFKTLIIALAVAAPATIISAPSYAGGIDTPRLDQAQKNQRHRIWGGVKNGSLTARETGHLLRGQARTHRMERRFESDGVITRSENRRLHRTMATQSARIWVNKHDRQRR